MITILVAFVVGFYAGIATLVGLAGWVIRNEDNIIEALEKLASFLRRARHVS